MENEVSKIFGLRAVIEAINSGKTISKVYLQKGLSGPLFSELNTLIKKHNISTSYVPVEKLNRFSKNNNHQGVAAQISPIDFVDLDTLITSIQDGLFSRFIFYSFSAKQKWRSTYTEAIAVSNNEIFKGFSADLCDKFRSNNTQKFVMTRAQGMQLDEVFSEALGHNSILYNDDVSSIIYRLGLMTFKIAMTLSALRSDDSEITCSDLEFKTSLDLVAKVYLRHSIGVLNKINKDSKKLNKTQDELLNWMKSKGEIKRGDVWNKAKTMDIKERTLADILRRFLDSHLIKKVNHGVYMVR